MGISISFSFETTGEEKESITGTKGREQSRRFRCQSRARHHINRKSERQSDNKEAKRVALGNKSGANDFNEKKAQIKINRDEEKDEAYQVDSSDFNVLISCLRAKLRLETISSSTPRRARLQSLAVLETGLAGLRAPGCDRMTFRGLSAEISRTGSHLRHAHARRSLRHVHRVGQSFV